MEEFKVENGKAIIPEGTEVIPQDVFNGNTDLKIIEIPASVKEIETGAFAECPGIETITVSDGNKKYNSPKGSNAIIERFKLVLGCKNTVIPPSQTLWEIGNLAFDNCYGLEKFEIPSSVKIIGDGAFFCCSGLKEINIPSSVKVIGYQAFLGTSLEHIEIPSSVTEIGGQAFYSSGLEKIKIPSSVMTIGHEAFADCSRLKCVEFMSQDKFDIDNTAFKDSPITTIIVPEKTRDMYKTMLPKELHGRIEEKTMISEEEIRLRVICAVLSGRFANKEYRPANESERKKLVSDAITMADEVVLEMRQKE